MVVEPHVYTSFVLFVRSQGQERFRVIPGGQRSNLIVISHLDMMNNDT